MGIQEMLQSISRKHGWPDHPSRDEKHSCLEEVKAKLEAASPDYAEACATVF